MPFSIVPCECKDYPLPLREFEWKSQAPQRCHARFHTKTSSSYKSRSGRIGPEGKLQSYLRSNLRGPEVNELIEELLKAALVVGFNHLRFNYEVLHGYSVIDLTQAPTDP